MKKFFFLFTVFAILSCSTYKRHYYPPVKNKVGSIQKGEVALLIVTGKVVFIKVYERDSLVFKRLSYQNKETKTVSRPLNSHKIEGLMVKVKKNALVKVVFEDIETPLLLTPKELEPYTKVSIRKKGIHATVDFGDIFQKNQ